MNYFLDWLLFDVYIVWVKINLVKMEMISNYTCIYNIYLFELYVIIGTIYTYWYNMYFFVQ